MKENRKTQQGLDLLSQLLRCGHPITVEPWGLVLEFKQLYPRSVPEAMHLANAFFYYSEIET